MASMREIKSRITATKKTSQITKAMYMVSASKVKKAEKVIKGFRPLMHRLRDMIDNLLATDDQLAHPMLVERQVVKVCYILVSSDRGLAGPYNSNIFKAFNSYILEHHKSNSEFVVGTIGYKAFTFAKRMGFELLNNEPIHVRDDIQFIDFNKVTDKFQTDYLNGTVDIIIVFYNHFINIMRQDATHTQILPVINGRIETKEEKEKNNNNIKLIYN